eukprot:g9057.t1
MEDLDLCFVIDTTGSMVPYIEAFKRQATFIADDIVKRVRASPKYNGHDDHLPKFAVVPFTDFPQPGHLDPSTIIDFIQDKDHFANSVLSMPRDRYPGGYPPGVTMENVMKRLQDQRIGLVFCRVNEVVTRQMENVMRDKYDSTERKMTSFSLSGADGFGPKVTDMVVNMLIEDHM